MSIFDQADKFLKSSTGQLVVSSLAPKPPKVKVVSAPAAPAVEIAAPQSFLKKNMLWIGLAVAGVLGAILLMRGKR